MSGSGEKSKAAFLEVIAPKLNLKGRQVGCRRRVWAGSRIKASMGVFEETASWLVEQLRWKPDKKTKANSQRTLNAPCRNSPFNLELTGNHRNTIGFAF